MERDPGEIGYKSVVRVNDFSLLLPLPHIKQNSRKIHAAKYIKI
jgi:hypothetical protein